MAASDQRYRNQKTLDIVFAVSCVAMLLTIGLMFAQDFFRDFKAEQRVFRDVETAAAERELADHLFGMMRDDAEQAVRESQRRIDALKVAVAHAQGADKEARQKELDAETKALADNEKYLKAIEGPEPDPAAFATFLDRSAQSKDRVAKAREDVEVARKQNADAIREKQVQLGVADAAYRGKKADYDSKESLYYIAVDRGESTDRLRQLEGELTRLRRERDDLKAAVEQATRDLADAQIVVTQAEANLAAAEKADKERRAQFDRYHKLVEQKQWSFKDEFLAMPVIDMFNSPYKIQQYTLAELPIDYSFKYVTRYDRCTTCHLGMEKANFDRDALTALTRDPKAVEARVQKFREVVEERERNRKPTGGFAAGELPKQLKTLSDSTLTPARVAQFAAHPRLDLFVHPDSPHPADKFGCTICHSGQGSATDFKNAVHAPNTPEQEKDWEGKLGYEHIHFWDFPMYPKRFTESTCLKCHHQVTDLVRYGSKEEAPKLIKGYELIKENGCFGCHEIAALNKGRVVGPDLRLEPGIPLDHLAPGERAKVLADTSNPPGTMRKVGPSLYRVAEKTNPDWISHWVQSPRGFRPDTKMPHFYGLNNNSRDELEKNAPKQKDFPNAEVQSIAAYLTYESQRYLEGKDRDAYRRPYLARLEQLRVRGEKGLDPVLLEEVNDQLVLITLKSRSESSLAPEEKTRLDKLARDLAAPGRRTIEQLVHDPKFALSDSEKKEFLEIVKRLQPESLPTLELLQPQKSLEERKDKLVDHEGREVTLPEWPKDNAARDAAVLRGARLFTERGCLACHRFGGTAPVADDSKKRRDDTGLTTAQSEATFGPDLSRLVSKLGNQPNDPEKNRESARRWLVQWLLYPSLHHPRTRMPVTFLNAPDKDGNLPANDIAVYLLEKSEQWLPSLERRLKDLTKKLKDDNALSDKEDEALTKAAKGDDVPARVKAQLAALQGVAKLTPDQRTELEQLESQISAALPMPPPDDTTLRELTAVYLGRVRPQKDVNDLLETVTPGDTKAAVEWLKTVKADSDEALLAGLDSPEMQRRLADPSQSESVGRAILANATSTENMRRYIGRKAITRQGCFACHNIPGYELAKPIGTPLNDWGKKDPERLAFEDAPSFVKTHFHVLPEVVTYGDLEARLRTILKSENVAQKDRDAADNVPTEEEATAPKAEEDKKAFRDPAKRVTDLLAIAKRAGGLTPQQQAEVEKVQKQLNQELWTKHVENTGERARLPYEEFFAEALNNHKREGFLQLKLAQPRSYDYKRDRAWDDRLRMPQFKFSHPVRRPGESATSFEVRALAEEAEAREAVMTFVLGLVAEPVPSRYVHTPPPDRAAEVKGRQVIEKFNCVGCHMVRSGVVEFRPNADTLSALNAAADKMLQSQDYKDDFADSPLMRVHTAWKAPPMPAPDRVRMEGTIGRAAQQGETPAQFQITLTQAVQFPGAANEEGRREGRELLAGLAFEMPASQPLISKSDPYGGAFVNVVLDYSAAELVKDTTKRDEARSKLPPQLLHEGERVQPEWLFQFLRNPTTVRSPTWMALRMPKFNMSEDDARALVDYFAAVDRLNNPGIGLTYPYEPQPQRDERYWREKTAAYRARLSDDQLKQRLDEQRGLWKLYAESQRADLKAKIDQTKGALSQAEKDVNDPAKKANAEVARDNAKAALERLGKEDADWKAVLDGNDKALEKQWLEEGVYSSDAYKVFLRNNTGICATCHDIGSMKSTSSKGPPLDQAFQRLRPDWTARWIAHPTRMIPGTIMPVNFPRSKEDDKAIRQLFEGGALDQVTAVRDILMDYPKQADRPWNRYFRP